MNIFSIIAQHLATGEGLVAAVIVGRSGSAPRSVGTRMVMLEDGNSIGTIGGGILETQVRRLAKEVFRHRQTLLREFSFTSEDAAKAGMICGGELQILIHYVDGALPSQLELYQALSSTWMKRKRAWLITKLPSENERALPPTQCLLGDDDRSTGFMEQNRLREIVARAGSGRSELVVHADALYLVERLGHEGTVFIFGGGHIARELAPLAKLVGFRTVIVDDREEFANRERFADADQVVVLDSFECAMPGLDIDENSYLVLVTRGHMHDKLLLVQALQTAAGYIGMIGSKKKRNAIYEALTKEGFSSRDFERVHSPIGLEIGAETPEEIAVSIVAELIKKRTEKLG
jgi:xanthine dehydrogenase accessory factor